jgi:hypothetical protein
LPADICQDNQPPAEPQDFSRCLASDKRRLRIEALRPPRHVIDAAIRIAQEARLDAGGIKYLVSERDGEVHFYDVNALSNFVTDALRIVGFDPYERFVDFVLQRAADRLTAIEGSRD